MFGLVRWGWIWKDEPWSSQQRCAEQSGFWTLSQPLWLSQASPWCHLWDLSYTILLMLRHSCCRGPWTNTDTYYSAVHSVLPLYHMTPERDSLTNASKSISDDVNLLMAKHASISRRAPGRRQYLALFSVPSQGVAGYQGWEQQILLTAEHQVPVSSEEPSPGRNCLGFWVLCITGRTHSIPKALLSL